MFKRKKHVAALGALAAAALVLPASASAADFTVNDNDAGTGPEGANCGAAQFESIQAAVAAADPGDTILVCSGTYNETVTIDKDDLTLLGAQAGDDARSRSGEESTISDGGVAIGADDVVFDGFTVEGGQNGANINTNGSSGVELSNNIIQGSSIGINLGNDGDDQAVVRHNLIRDNNMAGSAGGSGIYSDAGASNVLIEENRFSGHDNVAINFAGAMPALQRGIDVLDNQVVNDSAIVFFNASAVTVNGNRISGSNPIDLDVNPMTPEQDESSAIALGGNVHGASIKRNRVTGEPNSAVRIADFLGVGPNEGASVVGNTLTNNGFGVRVSDDGFDGRLRIEFNRIFGNDVGVANEDDTANTSDPEFDAENNWWGCNEGANEDGCDTTTGTVDSSPHLILEVRVKRTVDVGESGRIRVSVRRNSEGFNFGKRSLFPDGTKIRVRAQQKGEDIRVTPRTVKTFQGSALTAFEAQKEGRGRVLALLDAETAKDTYEVKDKG